MKSKTNRPLQIFFPFSNFIFVFTLKKNITFDLSEIERKKKYIMLNLLLIKCCHQKCQNRKKNNKLEKEIVNKKSCFFRSKGKAMKMVKITSTSNLRLPLWLNLDPPIKIFLPYNVKLFFGKSCV